MYKEKPNSYPYRRSFEHGADLLKELIESDRLKISSHCEQMPHSLMKVRMLPNGRLNLLTVDELVRSNFHMLCSNMMDNKYEKEK